MRAEFPPGVCRLSQSQRPGAGGGGGPARMGFSPGLPLPPPPPPPRPPFLAPLPLNSALWLTAAGLPLSLSLPGGSRLLIPRKPPAFCRCRARPAISGLPSPGPAVAEAGEAGCAPRAGVCVAALGRREKSAALAFSLLLPPPAIILPFNATQLKGPTPTPPLLPLIEESDVIDR